MTNKAKISRPKLAVHLHIRKLGSDELVHSVRLTSLREAHVEKVISGLERKTDLEKYWIDESESNPLQSTWRLKAADADRWCAFHP